MPTTVFVAVEGAAPRRRLVRTRSDRCVAGFPEIVEAWRLTGEIDYLLRIVVPGHRGLRCRLPAPHRQARLLEPVLLHRHGGDEVHDRRPDDLRGLTRGPRRSAPHPAATA
ncbi:Lrp/AsnC ligand binding domain-containing protein [Methylobacterium oryzae CBMB20]